MPFIPHTPSDEREMLDAIGVASLDDLFDEIPAALRSGPLAGIPHGLDELSISRLARQRAAQQQPLCCFAGAGAYEHHIPAAVWEIASRGEFYSAYTPYQAEASQGTLQQLYEFQSMIAGLTGLDVANASLYDGASALGEAILMAVRANRKAKSQRVLVPQTVHPRYRAVAHTLVAAQGIELVEVPFDPVSGRTDATQLERLAADGCAAVVVPQPNYFGVLEEAAELTAIAQRHGALAIATVNPTALAIVAPPGEWGDDGADIACGEGQPLGIPLSGGGPYFGFLACREALVRQMPGRIVGRTVDADGRPGFTLTLQAREQHIRRSRATSNICTNQGLMTVAATIYLSLLGPQGLQAVAEACHANLHQLRAKLCELPGVEPLFAGDCFHETALRLPQPATECLDGLLGHGILGGRALAADYPQLGEGALLVCATETRSTEEVAAYRDALHSLLDPS